ncbi:gp60 protein [Mycobacteroides abscessus subsp. bolletii]|uniref:PD-(D/E)XK nuclease-like domain-containing protein n=1 Tax=Mycobacteroides abscessus TaxID=36809 RepID=UPI0009A686BD|nr:PD-(D/E)XK nuclease-like domain-containing protein [Mycobacteroides abscessus]SKF66690.1 gp60 protein [Mycobacteroides abscessus subsp. bolletii]SKF71417.1 gp60 protein [Mycobacteroides abscessus subsp. bolletii]SKH46973.1 gp60 protein [Mycobacteroides abscessus subsp. bolletii]
MIELTRDGVYAGISDTEYHADRSALSSSGARLLLPPSTPAMFRWRMDNPSETKPEWDFGRMAHRVLLGAGAEICVLEPAIHGLTKGGAIAKSPRATDTWKEAEAEARAEGRVPVHVDDYQIAQAMADKVREHPTAGPLFAADDGQAETSLVATDPETGVRLKARPDWLNPTGDRLTIVDYKTAASSEADAFSRRAADYGYHIQDAWYRRVAQLLKLDDDPRFLFVVQEKEAPYEVSVFEYQDPIDKAESKRQMHEAISIYQRCKAEDKWPGRSPEITPIFLPRWAHGDDEMDI